MAIAKALEGRERQAAKERQRKHGGTAAGEHSRKLSISDSGQTRDKLARYAGMSGRTLEKAQEVVKAASAEPGNIPHWLTDGQGTAPNPWRGRQAKGPNFSARGRVPGLFPRLSGRPGACLCKSRWTTIYRSCAPQRKRGTLRPTLSIRPDLDERAASPSQSNREGLESAMVGSTAPSATPRSTCTASFGSAHAFGAGMSMTLIPRKRQPGLPARRRFSLSPCLRHSLVRDHGVWERLRDPPFA